jgi:hypothetical protein
VFYIAFWGQMPADPHLRRINDSLHREYVGLFERCLSRSWPEWAGWSEATREQILRSVLTFVNGITASTVANRSDWPARRQVEQLRLQLELLRGWARRTSR